MLGWSAEEDFRDFERRLTSAQISSRLSILDLASRVGRGDVNGRTAQGHACELVLDSGILHKPTGLPSFSRQPWPLVRGELLDLLTVRSAEVRARTTDVAAASRGTRWLWHGIKNAC